MKNPISMTIETPNIFSILKYFNYRRKKEILHYKKYIELKRMMRESSLSTFFQPILDLNTGITMGFEALNRPNQSKLFPDTESFYDFIGQTEQVFLFECFCRNLSLFRYRERLEGLDSRKDFLIFINIHPHVLLDPNYHSGETLSLLKEFKIKPQQVVFELTEKSAVTDFYQFEKVLANYRSQGYRIAIDDVGSGFNSLKTLIYLKPEFIKLDRSLIQNINRNEEQKKIVLLIIEYARQSKTKVIAEGIENLEELNYIREKGVHYGQGYALGKPKMELQLGELPRETIKSGRR